MKHSIRLANRFCVLTLFAACAAFAPSVLTAATNTVSAPAGFVRLVVPPEATRFAAMPLIAVDPGIEGVFSNQLTGATNEAAADRIQKWDLSGQEYTDAYKYSNGTWYADFTGFSNSALSFHPGEGFFIHNRQAVTQTVFLCGSVVLDGVTTQSMVSGQTFFGYPFSTARKLNDTGLAGSGAQAAADFTNADQVSIWDGNLGDYRSFGLKNSDNKWHASTNWTGPATDESLLLGYGQWFRRNSTNGLEWTENQPYAQLFPTDGNPPVITGLQPNAQQDEITLSIDATGIGIVEIYYKDLEPTNILESTGWQIAATNISGNGNIEWTDAGSGGRGKVNTVYARYYLVGNASRDSDGDGFPDSRETFVMGTDPTLSEKAPRVDNASGATNIALRSAYLCGNLTSTGAAPTTVRIYWGPSDGGTSKSAWSNSINKGTLGQGAFSSSVTGLTVGTTYYYRTCGSNSYGETWAASTTNFTTLGVAQWGLIGVDFNRGTNFGTYAGAAALGSTGDVWNGIAHTNSDWPPLATNVSLVNIASNLTGITLDESTAGNVSTANAPTQWTNSPYKALMSDLISYAPIVTLSGLAAGNYDLYLYAGCVNAMAWNVQNTNTLSTIGGNDTVLGNHTLHVLATVTNGGKLIIKIPTGWSAGSWNYKFNGFQLAYPGTVTNHAPTAANKTVTIAKNRDYTFAVSDFGYSDVDIGDLLAKIKVTAVPTNGLLKLNGVTVTQNQEISVTNLSGNLKFTPATNGVGTPYDTFQFQVADQSAYSDSAYTVTVNVPAPALINVDFNRGTNYGTQVGATSIGSTGDVWNGIPHADTDWPAVTNVVLVDCSNNVSGVTLTESGSLATANAPTQWGSSPYKALMADLISYSPIVTLTGLTPGDYDLYLYAGCVNAMAWNVQNTNTASTAGGNDTILANHSLHIVATVTNDGKLTIKIPTGWSAGSWNYKFNGFQLAPPGSVFNHSPTAANGTVTTAKNTDYTFAASDFNFSDVDQGDSLYKVKIATLPTNGVIKLNGTGVSSNQEIAVADLAGNLKYTPAVNGVGTPHATFQFQVSDQAHYSEATYIMSVNVPAPSLINVDFNRGTNFGTYSGAGLIGATGHVWNGIAHADADWPAATNVPLVDCSNSVTGVRLIESGSLSTANPPAQWTNSQYSALMSDLISYNPTITLTGLTPGSYDLFLYAGCANPMAWRVNGVNTRSTTGSANTDLKSHTGHAIATVTNGGNITIQIPSGWDANSWNYKFNGFQLIPSEMAPLMIDNTAITGITASAVWMNGDLLCTGGAPTHVWLNWGTNDCETGQWPNTQDLGIVGPGTLSRQISGLSYTNTPYYYRYLASNSTAGAVWATPSISFGGMRDLDGDGMPEGWEMFHGLNPLINDANLDPDGDGLSNLQEYRLGTHPQSADTDGDGASDYFESMVIYSDPLVVDWNGAVTTVATVDGSAATNWLGSWTREDSVIFARERSGYVEYSITFPTNGIFALSVEATQHNPLTTQNQFDLSVYVDGAFSGRQTLQASYGSTGSATFFTPTMSAGAHSVRILWRNLEPNTFLQINSLSLQVFGGPDDNNNGLADWMEHRQAHVSSLATQAMTSIVSPVCLEGTSYYQSMLSVSADYIPEGETQQVVTVKHGIGENWYADVLLSPTNDTVIQVLDQDGAIAYTSTVTWTEANILDGTYTNDVLIRAGSSLLLNAYPVGATNGTVTLTVLEGTNVLTNAVAAVGQPAQALFDHAGTFTVSGSYSNEVLETNSTITVRAVAAAFASDEVVCVASDSRLWTCPDIPTNNVTIEHDPALEVTSAGLPSGGMNFNLLNKYDVPFYMLARLGDGGPVLDSAKVSTVYGDNGSYWRVVENYADGSRLVEVRLQLGYVPSDIRVDLHVFVGGVTFDDGTIDRTLTAADFNEVGVATYYLVQGAGVTTSVCHSTQIYQGSTYIGGN